MNARPSSSLGARMLRALRLDPSLYREVASRGGSSSQAAVVLMFSAVSSGLVMGAVIAADWTTSWAYSSDTEVNLGLFADIAAGHAGSITVAHIAAWPIWTAGLWVTGKRLTAPGSQALGFGQVARALAFAQAPAIAGGPIVVPVVVGKMLLGHTALLGLGIYSSFFTDLVWSAVVISVLIATYLAVREALGLSSGQALGSLIIVGATVAVALGLVLTLVSIIVVASGAQPGYLDPSPEAWLRVDYGETVGPSIAASSAKSAAIGLDFSLGLRLNLVSFYRIVDIFAGIS